MKRRVTWTWAAMIIVMTLVLPAQGAELRDGVRAPDPVEFANTIELGDLKQAEKWLEAGLSPNFPGARIGAGLMIAAWEGNLEMMRLFLGRGAEINALNANGESALALAAWRGKLDAAKWLIERGARINSTGRQWSPLHYAVFAGHGEVVDYLIEQGADIEARSTNGSSVLMMAIYEGRADLARKLIEKGADRTVKNDWGDGALDWAMRYNHLNIAKMVANPEEFNIAVSQPKEKWGEAKRSFRTSKELEELLSLREKLLERKLPIEGIDRRIAAERVRIMRADMDRPAPARAPSLEISASREQPQKQSAQIIYDDKGKQVGFKAPAVTYTGQPKMPPKAPLRNY